MKKLILLTLLATSNLFGASLHKQLTYSNVPEWTYSDDVIIQSACITAAWAANFTVYNFEEFDFYHLVVYKASNKDCTIFIRFNRRTHDCEVDFHARNESYNYEAFKKIMDSFFMYDERSVGY